MLKKIHKLWVRNLLVEIRYWQLNYIIKKSDQLSRDFIDDGKQWLTTIMGPLYVYWDRILWSKPNAFYEDVYSLYELLSTIHDISEVMFRSIAVFLAEIHPVSNHLIWSTSRIVFIIFVHILWTQYFLINMFLDYSFLRLLKFRLFNLLVKNRKIHNVKSINILLRSEFKSINLLKVGILNTQNA